MGHTALQKLNFPYKSQPTQLGVLEPSLEHFRGSNEDPYQNVRQIGRGRFRSYDWTYKKLEKKEITTLYAWR